MEIIIGLLFWILILGIYFAPALIAKSRKHHNLTAITVTNLLLGWTVLFWVFALIWAFTSPVLRNSQKIG